MTISTKKSFSKTVDLDALTKTCRILLSRPGEVHVHHRAPASESEVVRMKLSEDGNLCFV